MTCTNSMCQCKSICYEKAMGEEPKFHCTKLEKSCLFFQLLYNCICIWQNYFCILPDFGAKTSLFRYLINHKRNNFIKHWAPPPCINKPPISEMCIYIRHNLDIVKPLGMKKGGGALKPFVHALDFATPVPYVMVFCGGCVITNRRCSLFHGT